MSTSKNVVITGSSNGIGYLSALTMARQGHKVYATMRGKDGKNANKRDELLQIGASEGLSIDVVDLDVTNADSVHQAADHIIKDAGKVDVLLNNAGVMFIGVTEAYTIDQVKDQFDVNVFGLMRVSKAFIPHMRKNQDGLIINISSIAGRLSMPFAGVYCASKHAVEAYSQSLQYELNPSGVDVTLVEPGPFPSGLLHSGPKEADKSVLDSYGEMAEVPGHMLTNFEQLFNSPDAPNTQDVADVIAGLVNTPKGQRATRTAVGMDFGTTELNKMSESFQTGAVHGFQMSHLLDLKI